jgi:hypothetical protein
MRKPVYIVAGVLLVLLVLAVAYELAFRAVAAEYGELDLRARPARVCYYEDELPPFPWRSALFGLRTRLPLGKVRLRCGAYVNGGRVYRRLPDKSWEDLTDTIVEWQKIRQLQLTLKGVLLRSAPTESVKMARN